MLVVWKDMGGSACRLASGMEYCDVPQQWGRMIRMADALSTENVTVVNVAIHIQMWSRTVTEQLQRSTSVTLLVWNGYDSMISMIVLFGLKCNCSVIYGIYIYGIYHIYIWHISYGIYYMAYIIWLMLSEGLVVCLTFPGHLTWCCGFDQVAPWHEAPVRCKSCQGYPCHGQSGFWRDSSWSFSLKVLKPKIWADSGEKNSEQMEPCPAKRR